MSSAIKGLERLTRDEQKNNVQKFVSSCLERKQKLLQERKRTEDVLKVFNMVLDDLKEGRLDRILEMQQRDPRTIEMAGFSIKEGVVSEIQEKGGKWYKPYVIEFASGTILTVNCSSTKDFAIGTYLVGPEKEVIHFRK